MHRVLFVTNGYPSQKAPFLCHFIKTQKEQIESYSKYEIDLLIKNGFLGYFGLLIRFLFLYRKYKVIHVHQGLTFITLSPVLLFIRRKVVLSVLNEIENEFIESRLSPVLLSYFKFVLTFCPVSVISKNDRDKVFYKSKKVKHNIIPNGVILPKQIGVDDLNVITCVSEFNAEVKRLKLLFVSSKSLFRPQKRFDLFLELIESLKIPCEYLVAYNDSNNVLQQKYRWADVHVLTSDFEGSPNSVKEAVSNGCWVVSFDVGDVAQIIRGSKFSRVVSSLEEMIRVLNATWNEFVENREDNSLLVKNKYEASSVVEQILDVYEKS